MIPTRFVHSHIGGLPLVFLVNGDIARLSSPEKANVRKQTL